ncbi:MAG TPA: agmatine deiminase family protein [Dysgonamonadaceae bacterium]|nr:agmatine deiminase family protein [Dysgonamonadaceae bacterium]
MTSIHFPAEWHPQSAIQITWPHNDTDWVEIIDEVTDFYVKLSKEILKHTQLLIVCNEVAEVKKYFTPPEQTSLIFAEVKSNDTWARDHGAISVFINNQPVIYDFGFNAWGLKFPANHDNQITQKLFVKSIFANKVKYHNHLDFILEGGAIESDGEGTLLTTSKCLLAPNRNQPLTKDEIEEFLKNALGLEQILWLNHGYLSGDDTDNHIDTLARFCNTTTIAYVQCTDENDEHYQELKKMEEELATFNTLTGKPYNLIPLPMADAVYEDNYRLPATYANFLIMDTVVLMPTYCSNKDVIAKKQLQKAFPNKEIIGIDCRTLIKQHGSLHCITMQYPEGFIYF